MHWIKQYSLIFFDFDGLLVNTEHLHFQAYQNMCCERGYKLDWDFKKYCLIAHASSEGLRRQICLDIPELLQQEWAILYEEKKAAYRKILSQGLVQLMPGVEDVLCLLQEYGIRACVVTNSFKEQVEAIRRQIPVLEKLSYWVTREDYLNPKPSPDPYLVAKKKWAHEGDRILGFEDTIRGLKALRAAEIEAVLISDCLDQEFHKDLDGSSLFSSFTALLS